MITATDEWVDAIVGSILTRAELAELPPPSWVVHRWVPARGLACLFGEPGGGKTFAALDLACSIGTGRRWQHYDTQPGRVLYVAAEGAHAFHDRVSAWEELNDTTVTELFIVPDAVNVADPIAAEALAIVAGRIGAHVVVLDTLARCMVGCDENSARDMSQFIAGCDQIRTQAGAAVLVLHHKPRGGNNPRGSTALEGACDTLVELTADGPIVTLRTTKQKEAEPEPALTLRLVPAGASAAFEEYHDTDALSPGRLAALRVLGEMAGDDGISGGDWQRASAMALRTFHRHRQWLLKHGYCHPVGGTRYPRYAPTDKGRAASATECQPSAMALPDRVPATPTPLRGGTGTGTPLHDGTTTND